MVYLNFALYTFKLKFGVISFL